MVKKFYICLENSEEWECSDDWGLFVAKFYFPDAKIKENKVNVPGRNGVIDLSSELTGDVAFNNVNGKIDFIILRNSNFDYHYFKNKYHGMRIKIMSDQETDFYRIGRLTITDDNQQDVLKKISMNIDADPFKYSTNKKEAVIPVISVLSEMNDFEFVEDAINDEHSFDSSYDSLNKKITIKYRRRGPGIYTTPYNKVAYFSVSANTRYSFGCNIKIKELDSKVIVEDISVKLYRKGSYIIDNPQDFNSESTTEMAIEIYIKLRSTAYTEGKAYYSTFEFDNFYLIPLIEGQRIEISNNGRKAVVPEIISDVDCKISTNGTEIIKIYKENPTPIFDFDLKQETASIVAYGEQEGTATISFREAYL